MKNYCVVTTINKPTKAIEELYKRFGHNLIVVADEKTPKDWGSEHRYGIVPIWKSDKLYAPNNHYARKNIGYMVAIFSQAELIYDTDDDNIPNENWVKRCVDVTALESFSIGWFNVYTAFTSFLIWPRGFPLKLIKDKDYFLNSTNVGRVSSIQQGLSSGEPDVDAVWRLTKGRPIYFITKTSIYLQANSWCPFNSQTTWWFPKAYVLMYLPIYSNFRMTDIWRSFVAQKCLWELGDGVTFHSPSEVFQDRNEHDLLKDFEDEIPGYLLNERIVEILRDLTLKSGQQFVCDNMLTCYQAIVDDGILPQKEIESLKEWIKDYEYATGNMQ